jgi:hypothetical protein
MKQQITQEQYEELPDDARMKWITWTMSKGAWAQTKKGPPSNSMETYRSIGYLIQFIDEHIRDSGAYWKIETIVGCAWRVQSLYESFNQGGRSELCDTLWEAVKLLLERCK